MNHEELLDKLTSELMDAWGNCLECNQNARQPPRHHHANCPIGRLVTGDTWARLITIRQINTQFHPQPKKAV
jgi:hypothetical protein